MRDDDDGFGAVDQKIFEPLHRFDVEVVGRLVEQDEVGFLQQDFGQLDAHTPAPAKLAGEALKIIAFETKTQQYLFHLGIDIYLFERIKFLAEGAHPLDEAVVFFRFIVGSAAQLLVDGMDLGFHGKHMGKGLGSFVEHGATVGGEQVLGKIGNHSVVGSGHAPTCGSFDTGNDFEQG